MNRFQFNFRDRFLTIIMISMIIKWINLRTDCSKVNVLELFKIDLHRNLLIENDSKSIRLFLECQKERRKETNFFDQNQASVVKRWSLNCPFSPSVFDLFDQKKVKVSKMKKKIFSKFVSDQNQILVNN